MVLIGVDPHKRSHTAVVVDSDEHELGRLTVRADRRQLERLLSFASPFGERTWAIESAEGSGSCSHSSWSRPVRPSSTCRRRWLLSSGRGSKNDPNDEPSTASPRLPTPHLRTGKPRTTRWCCGC